MGELRACVYFCVIFLCFHVAVAKPMFGMLWCEVVCVDDDDEITTTTASSEFDWDDILCGACEPNRPRTTTPNPLTVNPMNPVNPNMPQQPPFNLMIPPSNGMNVTMWQPNNGGSWWMNFIPWGPGSGPGGPAGPGGPPPGAPTGMPPATTPAATTPAPGATTTAGAATTAAPTTAAPARK